MDSSLIKEFRNKVNKHDLILHIYQNYNGKNKWNIICSAMDWIQVGVSGIDINTLERTNSDQASVKVITYISTIDVMWEGIGIRPGARCAAGSRDHPRCQHRQYSRTDPRDL